MEIADKDSVLFLWATFPNLPEAMRVIKAWGYTYKTVAFVWIKKNKKADSLFLGMGFWTRSNAEVCLLATNGNLQRISAKVRQVIIAPVSAHSQKPEEARERIVELMGDLPRIELFARQRSQGWHVWGNEVECDIELSGNPHESEHYFSGGQI
jgi:N6-adenosine-specific RNA methylase IME4